jgi:hypothetical protein
MQRTGDGDIACREERNERPPLPGPQRRALHPRNLPALICGQCVANWFLFHNDARDGDPASFLLRIARITRHAAPLSLDSLGLWR